MLKGFRDFLVRGNVIDLATAVIVGGAFTAIVTAFSDNIIKPLINALGGTNAAAGLGFHILSGNASTFVNLGALVTAIINFIIIAAVVYFVIVLPYEKLKSKRSAADVAADPTETELLVQIRDLLAGKESAR